MPRMLQQESYTYRTQTECTGTGYAI